MPGRGSISERLHFAAKNAERREKVRQKLAEASAKLVKQRAVAATLETDDQDLAERIQALGFDGDSARVFDLLPLIHVSWADGKIQRNERATILSILSSRQIEPDSEAFVLVESLLESRPAPEYMEASLHLLRDLLAARGNQADGVLELCIQVADAAGGILGVGNRISKEERQMIEQIAEQLGPDAHKSFISHLK